MANEQSAPKRLLDFFQLPIKRILLEDLIQEKAPVSSPHISDLKELRCHSADFNQTCNQNKECQKSKSAPCLFSCCKSPSLSKTGMLSNQIQFKTATLKLPDGSTAVVPMMDIEGEKRAVEEVNVGGNVQKQVKKRESRSFVLGRVTEPTRFGDFINSQISGLQHDIRVVDKLKLTSYNESGKVYRVGSEMRSTPRFIQPKQPINYQQSPPASTTSSTPNIFPKRFIAPAPPPPQNAFYYPQQQPYQSFPQNIDHYQHRNMQEHGAQATSDMRSGSNPNYYTQQQRFPSTGTQPQYYPCQTPRFPDRQQIQQMMELHSRPEANNQVDHYNRLQEYQEYYQTQRLHWTRLAEYYKKFKLLPSWDADAHNAQVQQRFVPRNYIQHETPTHEMEKANFTQAPNIQQHSVRCSHNYHSQQLKEMQEREYQNQMQQQHQHAIYQQQAYFQHRQQQQQSHFTHNSQQQCGQNRFQQQVASGNCFQTCPTHTRQQFPSRQSVPENNQHRMNHTGQHRNYSQLQSNFNDSPQSYYQQQMNQRFRVGKCAARTETVPALRENFPSTFNNYQQTLTQLKNKFVNENEASRSKSASPKNPQVPSPALTIQLTPNYPVFPTEKRNRDRIPGRKGPDLSTPSPPLLSNHTSIIRNPINLKRKAILLSSDDSNSEKEDEMSTSKEIIWLPFPTEVGAEEVVTTTKSPTANSSTPPAKDSDETLEKEKANQKSNKTEPWDYDPVILLDKYIDEILAGKQDEARETAELLCEDQD